jgi:phosphoribosyl 1,2-cyclic phosphodiesterase
MIYIPDNEMFTRRVTLALNGLDTGVHGVEKSLEYALDQESKLRSFIYGADALIMDAQYDSKEYASHVGWGHGCLDDVVEAALKANVGKLFLFHHDPSHDDLKIQSMEEHARYLVKKQRSPMEVYAAREGIVIELGSELSPANEI